MNTENNLLECGFAISLSDDMTIKDNARDLDIDLSKDEDWQTLIDDSMKIEQNTMKFLKSKLNWARDEGHDSYSDLIGSCDAERGTPGYDFIMYYSEQNRDGSDRLEMDCIYEGISDLGKKLIDVELFFFNVDNDEYESWFDNWVDKGQPYDFTLDTVGV